jgi:hypothetical protein
MTATAHCHRCNWTTTGTWTHTDHAADKHTRPGHPTATIATPARRNT